MIKKTMSPFKELKSLGNSYSGNCDKQPPEKWDCDCSESYAGDCHLDDCVCNGDCACNCDCNCVCDCGSLDENGVLTIPNGTVVIRDYTYQNETGITKVVLPEGLTTVGGAAFAGCTNLQEVVLPSTLTHIGRGAFFNTALKTLTIPQGLQEIGCNAFDKCQKLEAVHITDLDAWCRIKFESANANPLHLGAELKLNGQTVSELTLDQMSSIPPLVFANYKHLKKIHVKDVATLLSCNANLDKNSFTEAVYHIDGKPLLDVVIPEGVKEIPEKTFYGQPIKSVTFPKSLKTIGNSAFCHCEQLEVVNIPIGVLRVGRCAFYRCYGLKEIHLSAADVVPTEICAYCKNLEKVTIAEGATYISGNAFYNCENLTEVVLPDSLQQIDYSAFQYCKKLTQINMPKKLKKVAGNAFEYAPAEYLFRSYTGRY